MDTDASGDVGEFVGMFNELVPAEQDLAIALWDRQDGMVSWPTACSPGPLLEVQRVGVKYHDIPADLRARARAQKVAIDGRSNGPAIMAFLLAGGHRPVRSDGKHGWSIHHIYDGKFPWPGRETSVRAVAETAYFTDARGLVALHPIFDGAVSEIHWLAWQLRLEAFDRFGFDPDNVLADYRQRHPVVSPNATDDQHTRLDGDSNAPT